MFYSGNPTEPSS